MLLEAGARQLPDERRKLTPLMLAAARSHDHIIRILVSPRFLSSMSPRDLDSLSKQVDTTSCCARLRLHKSASASKHDLRVSFSQRYYPALLNILDAKSLNGRRAVDWAGLGAGWAGLRDQLSDCAIFLQKLYENAITSQRSVDAHQIAPRRDVPSEPVILQRSFLSWEYMRFFALKYNEASQTRCHVSAQRGSCLSSVTRAADGCSCSAMFCVPGLCFCLKGDMNSRVAADLGCLRDDGMNLDLDFAHPFVKNQCETFIRFVQEKGFSVDLYDDFDHQMYNIPPDDDADCNWFSVGTKLATPDSISSSRNQHNDVSCLSMINLIGVALVIQLLPRFLTSKNAGSWRWSDPTYSKFRQEVLALLLECASDCSKRTSCFASLKGKILDLSCEFPRVCEGTSSWGRSMLQDWQDFGFHLWRAEVLCCDSTLSL